MATVTDVVGAITRHHGELTDAVTDRVRAVLVAVRAGASYTEQVAQLGDLLTHTVLPHARAEEEVLYAAADTDVLRPLVTGMTYEHKTLLALTDRLAAAATGVDAAATAVAIEAVFLGHVRRENDLLLPALAADPHIDLPALLPVMERLFAAYRAA